MKYVYIKKLLHTCLYNNLASMKNEAKQTAWYCDNCNAGWMDGLILQAWNIAYE